MISGRSKPLPCNTFDLGCRVGEQRGIVARDHLLPFFRKCIVCVDLLRKYFCICIVF